MGERFSDVAFRVDARPHVRWPYQRWLPFELPCQWHACLNGSSGGKSDGAVGNASAVRLWPANEPAYVVRSTNVQVRGCCASVVGSHDPDPTVSAREPPPVSMNSFMQHPNISQYNMQASMRERYAGWIRPCMCWKCTLMTAAGVHCQGGDDDQQGARQTSVGGRGCDPFEHGSFTTFMFCCALACSCVLFVSSRLKYFFPGAHPVPC